MQKKDYKKFAECIAGLLEVFTPDKPISKQKTEIYFQAFQDWTIEQFEQACINILQTKKISTFPLPAELRQAYGEEDKALEAWLMVRRAIGEYGYYISIIFPDPVIHSVINAMGGWQEASLWTTEDYVWKQKEFERIYNIMKNKTDHPRKVIGYYETRNNAKGFNEDTTVKIGEMKRKVIEHNGKEA